MTDPTKPIDDPTNDDVRAFLAEPEIAMVLDGLGFRYSMTAMISCLIAAVPMPDQLGVSAEVLRNTPGIEPILGGLPEIMIIPALDAIARSANANWDAALKGANALRLGHDALQKIAAGVTLPSDDSSTAPG